MIRGGKLLSKAGRIIAVAVLMAAIISSSLTVACDSGIWADKATYKSHSDVQLSYDTPDITNGSHSIKVFKDDTEVYSSGDLGKSNNGSATWSDVADEGCYTAKLFVDSYENGTCTFTVRNDAVAPTTTYVFSKPKKADGSYETGVRLSFSATDNEGGSGVAAIYYWYSDGNHKQYEAPLKFDRAGTYTITFKSMDHAGNLETVDGQYRTLTFTVTAPAPTPSSTPEPTATPTISPTIEPTVQPVPITETAHEVTSQTDGTEALFTTGQAQPSASAQDSHSRPDTLVMAGLIGGVAIIAGAALLFFRRL